MFAPQSSPRTFVVASCAALILACGSPPAAEPASSGPPAAGPIPEGWVSARAARAEARLTQSEAGTLVWQAIEAHGGLATWLAAGTMRFEFDYAPIDQPERRMHTVSRVDTWRARAVQEEVGEGADARLGWDGSAAWITPSAEAFPSTARFWATTPYYFVGVPFVFADPGTRLTRMPDEELDGATANVVRVEFESGTGDSPDDYYILMLDPSTHRVRALRYVVAYPGFFPEGGHSPEKLMRYGGLHEVNGLLIAATLHTSSWDVPEGTERREVTRIEVSDVAFGETYEASLFAAPEGAVSSTEIETRPR